MGLRRHGRTKAMKRSPSRGIPGRTGGREEMGSSGESVGRFEVLLANPERRTGSSSLFDFFSGRFTALCKFGSSTGSEKIKPRRATTRKYRCLFSVPKAEGLPLQSPSPFHQAV